MDKLKIFFKTLSKCNCFSTHSNDNDNEPTKPKSTTSSKTSSTDQHPPTTLIISHGAFQTQYHYQPFITALQHHTPTIFHRVLVPQQSSSGHSPPPNSFESDVELLHETVRNELLDGRDVLLVCHSYGGIPGCEALADLPEKALDGRIRLGRVLGIVFVSAFVAEAGQSLVTSKMGGRAEWVKTEGPLSTVLSPSRTLFSSLPPTASVPYITHIVPQSSTSFITPTKHETWKDHPCVYIRCLEDRAMRVEEQDFFLQRLKNRCGVGNVRVRDLKSDHVPFSSRAGELVGLLGGLVGELRDV
ncbi:hypothetical protein M409DRAFT_59865 [Zasmidium cellare ATCC 36951]|uniref:AB hydrolase-1 domain-containing protein n=1 Tax=Zasmidium cellare ATCC 36951 TaxID=1080233 RepID=A0A6A6C428_ZASCE|nr:uncharacterized protein M409DRAFT_59865 [Zasmidium cellare ATCC 36951]KAF2160612.1 hypothetical protein M409DRAFT_59865 [Zasmidium cellare ATCC 36951]